MKNAYKMKYREKIITDFAKKKYKENYRNDVIDKSHQRKNKNNFYKKEIKKNYVNNVLICKYKNKRKIDTIYQIIDNLSKRATQYFKKHNIKRKITHIELIGCNADKLKEHLHSKFVENMSYENYGKWEVDHIKPISLCDHTNINDIYEHFNYKNLQPLWESDNRKKSNKLNYEYFNTES